MPDSKKPSIPSWQQAQPPPSSSPESSEAKAEEADTTTTATQQESEVSESFTAEEKKALRELAEKFLGDPEVKDEPIEQKRAFLESKGVPADDISELLDKDGKEAVAQDAEEAKTVLDTSDRQSAPQPQSQALATQSQQPLQSKPPPQVQTAPPIVTYPEFLTQPTEKPPLVTVSRLVNTAYIAGGISATIYGLSKYVVAPMLESLTVARHDFAGNTHTRLDEFNEKLAGVVSVDPATRKARSVISEALGDDSSVDSDPTELFHRDFGTQTSPSLSRRPSTSAVAEDNLSPNVKIVKEHQDRLKIMTSHLNDLSSIDKTNNNTSDTLKKELDELNAYLTEMKFQSPISYMADRSYGVAKPVGDASNDAVEALRADIRSVKGVLLSARNFPASGGRPAGRVGT